MVVYTNRVDRSYGADRDSSEYSHTCVEQMSANLRSHLPFLSALAARIIYFLAPLTLDTSAGTSFAMTKHLGIFLSIGGLCFGVTFAATGQAGPPAAASPSPNPQAVVYDAETQAILTRLEQRAQNARSPGEAAAHRETARVMREEYARQRASDLQRAARSQAVEQHALPVGVTMVNRPAGAEVRLSELEAIFRDNRALLAAGNIRSRNYRIASHLHASQLPRLNGDYLEDMPPVLDAQPEQEAWVPGLVLGTRLGKFVFVTPDGSVHELMAHELRALGSEVSRPLLFSSLTLEAVDYLHSARAISSAEHERVAQAVLAYNDCIIRVGERFAPQYAALERLDISERALEARSELIGRKEHTATLRECTPVYNRYRQTHRAVTEARSSERQRLYERLRSVVP